MIYYPNPFIGSVIKDKKNEQIYLDNAATSFPKPQGVARAVYKYIKYCGANAGRGGHKMAQKAMEAVYNCREETAELFGITQPERLVFTQNATEALNLAIKGLLTKGAHVITSPLEHNSVARPLYELNTRVDTLSLNKDGSSQVEDIARLIKWNTRLVVINHASNVSGIINDIEQAAYICRVLKLPLLIDAAQTAGVIPLNAKRLGAMIAFPGHKSLLGPQGTGGLYIPEGINLRPLKTGGTGSHSESLKQPDFLPDKLESGTMNVPALAGLLEGVRFVKEVGREKIYEHEKKLTQRLIEGLLKINNIDLICPYNNNRVGTVSFTIKGIDAMIVSQRLDEEFSIASRSGLHCAPMAHKAYGSFTTGTARLSVGWFNTSEHIDAAIDAVKIISKH